MTDSSDNADARAAAYESEHRRIFVLRLVVTLAAIAGYLLTGASAELAEGLRHRFAGSNAVVVGLYLAITLFGFAVLMFPLSYYGDHLLEHKYGMSNQGFGGWLFDYFKAVALEVGLGVVFFGLLYAVIAVSGAWWWAGAAALYIAFSVVVSAIAPVLILPLFHDLEPLDESPLTQRITSVMTGAGLTVVGVYRWGLKETTNATNAALAGLGRTRRIILGDEMIDSYSEDEILAVLAHEVGHYRHADLSRMIAVGSVLALLGFFLADVVLRHSLSLTGFSSIGDIAGFPLMVLALFVFSLVTMPLTNAHSRAREYAADAYAVRTMGSADALVSALEKLAAQNLAEREPPGWIEFLLHSHPSIAKRVARARTVGPATAAGRVP